MICNRYIVRYEVGVGAHVELQVYRYVSSRSGDFRNVLKLVLAEVENEGMKSSLLM